MLICILCFSQTAQAQAPQAKFDMVGIGAISCQQWSETEADDFIKGAAIQWVYGYFSGQNKVRAIKKIPQYNLTRLTPSNILEAIDSFCPHYPEYRLHYAADAMVGKVVFIKQQ